VRFLFILAFFATAIIRADVLIDQISIIVDKSIIKASDIDRDVRLTEFLNSEPVHIDQADRRVAAKRLIEQALLRSEIQRGGYPQAKETGVDAEIQKLINSRFATEGAMQGSLKAYGLNIIQLRERLRWQLTLMQFIDLRFGSAVVVEQSSIDTYINAHRTELLRSNPKASESQLRSQTRDILVDEGENKLLYSWLDERRKDADIKFMEEGLT
jgi:hypothetical protein